MQRTGADIFIMVVFTVSFTILLISCGEDERVEVFFEEDELLISDYLEAHPDEFATLIRVLEVTNLKATLNAYGHYTFFAPDDEAFDRFIQGQYAGDYEAGLIAEFDEYLPENPPWIV